MKICPFCKERPRKSVTIKGRVYLRKSCARCRKKPYAVFKREKCEFCGFIPIHKSQLDVDHINGNHKDNRIENLQTLCANCHRLKTLIDRVGPEVST